MRDIVFLLCLLLIIPNVSAVAIGVNRASVDFSDVLRGGYAQAQIVVTTDSEEPVSGEVLIDESEAAQWLNFSDRNFTFSVNSPYTLLVDIQPPQDARIQSYRVNMSILTGELTRSEGGNLGTTTRASLGVPVILSMTGTERAACQIGGVIVQDAERGDPLEVRLSVINTGNVRINPTVEIEVRDKFQSAVVLSGQSPFGESVLPTATRERSVFFPLSLPRDQYWITLRVPQCADFATLATFDVLEAGEIKDDGEFLSIDAPTWANVGDILQIDALFRNRGVRSLRAVFKGTISRVDNGQIVKVIDTTPYLVDPSVTARIETFFNPTEPGQYVVSGRIFYNDKITTERNAIINVNGSSLGGLVLRPRTLVILGLLVLIAILLILIIRKKRSAQHHPGHHPQR